MLLLAQIDDIRVEDSDELGLVHKLFLDFKFLGGDVLEMATDRVYRFFEICAKRVNTRDG